MAEEKISHEFRQKNIDEKKNYLIEVINRNKLMSNKHKKVCITLNYTEHFLILGSTITGCVSIYALLVISIGITSSMIGLRSCVITAVIKKYKSIIKKSKRKHDEIILLENLN